MRMDISIQRKEIDTDFFKCFSVPLKKFLMEKGLEYKMIAIDPSSNKKFWLFVENIELSKALKEWKRNKPL